MSHLLVQSNRKKRKRCRIVVDPVTGRKKKVCEYDEFGGGGGGYSGGGGFVPKTPPARKKNQYTYSVMDKMGPLDEDDIFIGEPENVQRNPQYPKHGDYYRHLKGEYKRNRSWTQLTKDVVNEIPNAVKGISKNIGLQLLDEYRYNPAFRTGVHRLVVDPLTAPLLQAIGSYESGVGSIQERGTDLLKLFGRGAKYLGSSLPGLLTDPIDTVVKGVADFAAFGIPRLAQEQALFSSALMSNDAYLYSLSSRPKETIKYTLAGELAAAKVLFALLPYAGYAANKGLKSGQTVLSQLLTKDKYLKLADERPKDFSDKVGKKLARELVDLSELSLPADADIEEKRVQKQIFGPLRKKTSEGKQVLPEPLLYRSDWLKNLEGLQESMTQTPAVGKGRINMLRIRSLNTLYRESLAAPVEERPKLLSKIATLAHELRYNVGVDRPATTEEDFPVPAEDLQNLFRIEENVRDIPHEPGINRAALAQDVDLISFDE